MKKAIKNQTNYHEQTSPIEKILEEIKKEEWWAYPNKEYALERAIKKLKFWKHILRN